MDIVTKAAQALLQVVVVGLLLGAGLPALFAVGIRSLNTGRTVGKVGAVVCFGICVIAVIAGIIIIIFGKRLFAG